MVTLDAGGIETAVKTRYEGEYSTHSCCVEAGWSSG